jgi:hypothetical protein
LPNQTIQQKGFAMTNTSTQPALNPANSYRTAQSVTESGTVFSGCRWRVSKPYAPGLYAIYLDRELVYIGQSAIIAVRIPRHVKERRVSGERVLVKSAAMPGSTASQRVKRERRLMERLRPIWNSFGDGSGRPGKRRESGPQELPQAFNNACRVVGYGEHGAHVEYAGGER